MTEYELHTQGAKHSFDPVYDGNDKVRNKPYSIEADLFETKRQLAALTEDYKDLEAQLMAVGAGGVSKLMGDKE